MYAWCFKALWWFCRHDGAEKGWFVQRCFENPPHGPSDFDIDTNFLFSDCSPYVSKKPSSAWRGNHGLTKMLDIQEHPSHIALSTAGQSGVAHLCRDDLRHFIRGQVAEVASSQRGIVLHVARQTSTARWRPGGLPGVKGDKNATRTEEIMRHNTYNINHYKRCLVS